MKQNQLSRVFRRAVWIGVFCTFAVALGLTGWQLILIRKAPQLPISLPPPSGSYLVGRKCFDWIDEKRQDPFDSWHRRELVVWAWYPAGGRARASPAPYVPGRWGLISARWSALTVRLHMSPSLFNALGTPPPLAASSLEKIQTHSWVNAPLSTGESKFPVLIFSPGLGQMPTDYTALIEDIVSHGYIVFGINPTYFTDSTVFSNGREVGHMPIWKRSLDIETYYPIWVDDFLFVLEQIVAMNSVPGNPFCGHLALDRLGAFGHSYGGAAAIGASYRDSRIRAGADLDGSPRGERKSWALKQPFLVLQSEQGIHRDRRQVQFAKGLEHGRLIIIHGAHHAAFTDAVGFPLDEPGRTNWIGRISAARMVKVTSLVLRQFFDGRLNEGYPATLTIPELSIER